MDEKTEKETIASVNNLPSTDVADSSIISNFSLQASLFGVLLFFWLYFRKKVKWLYSPNIQNRPTHPCYGYNGYLSWIIPMVTISDTVLLSLIGLDAFMMLQTLNLMLRILFVLTIVLLPSLGYFYWNFPRQTRDDSEQILTKLAMENVDIDSVYYYLIPGFIYFASLLVYYLVFVYYKRYTILRQLYLRNPSTMTSIITLKKLQNQLGSADEATNFMSLPNRTLIMTRIPSYVRNDADLLDFINYLDVGEVEDCILIKDTTYLQSLYLQRNEYIEQIEKEINLIIYKMNKYSKKNKELCLESIDNFSEDLMKTITECYSSSNYSLSSKKKILALFINHEDDFKTKYRGHVKALDFYFTKLEDSFSMIEKEKNRIKEQSVISETEDYDVIEIAKEEHSLFIPGDEEDISFFSFAHIFNYRKYKMYLTLDLPINTKKGFVTFKSYKDASIIKQAKLGSRIFSVTASSAPTPNDIIWQNITKGDVSNFLYRLFGDITFFIFNILFTFIVVFVIGMLQLDSFDESSNIRKFFENHKQIKGIYEGIIPPVVYSLLLFFVPTIITSLVNMEGVYSYSSFQKKMLEKYCNFLFFNGFISFFLSSTLFTNITNIVTEKKTLNEVIDDFGSELYKTSVFFFNTSVQKALMGTMIFMLKPGPLIVNHLLVALFAKKTRREEEQAKFSLPFDFGSVFPAIMIVFPITLVYGVICPPILLPGFFFFAFNHFAIKYEFLYASRNEYESGGEYWDASCKLILYSLLVFQLATTAKMFSDGRKLLCLSIVPLLWLTLTFNSNLKKIFSQSCNCYPLNIKEEEYLDRFTEKLESDRIKMLESWEEFIDEDDPDTIALQDIGFVDKHDISKTAYYSDPSTAISISNFIFPKNFFNCIDYLLRHDNKNLFGYNDKKSE